LAFFQILIWSQIFILSHMEPNLQTIYVTGIPEWSTMLILN
jgi:hypothetical protein